MSEISWKISPSFSVKKYRKYFLFLISFHILKRIPLERTTWIHAPCVSDIISSLLTSISHRPPRRRLLSQANYLYSALPNTFQCSQCIARQSIKFWFKRLFSLVFEKWKFERFLRRNWLNLTLHLEDVCDRVAASVLLYRKEQHE